MSKPQAMVEGHPVRGGDRGGVAGRKGQAKTERAPWPADGPKDRRRRQLDEEG